VARYREASRELVIGSVLTELLGILDDVGRARDAGELEGAFKAVAESLERVTEKLGLERFGEKGDAFDPRIHEALLHNYSDEVDGPTATMVMQPGYRLGERVLRAARVAVSEPTEQLPADAVQADVLVETTDEDADKSAD
jgi:molecular chaperone GrpE